MCVYACLLVHDIPLQSLQCCLPLKPASWPVYNILPPSITSQQSCLRELLILIKQLMLHHLIIMDCNQQHCLLTSHLNPNVYHLLFIDKITKT